MKKDQAVQSPAGRLRARRKKRIMIALAAAVVILAAVVIGVCVQVLPGRSQGQAGQGQQSEGFPYSINSNLVRDMRMLGPDVLLLTDEAVTVLDSSGREVSRMPHAYKRPAMDLRAGRLIVYDRGGRKLRLQNRTKILLEKELESDIVTCAIGRSGNFAVATREDNAASFLTVYDKNVNEVFKWRSSNDYIMDIVLSDDGKYAAVAVAGSSSGKLYSKTYVFAFSKDKPLASLEYPGVSLFDVSFSGKSTILVTGDSLRGVIQNRTKMMEPFSFGTNELRCFSASEEGESALVLAEYGSMNANDLIVYDEEGRCAARAGIRQEHLCALNG